MRRALVVGINKYNDQVADLGGCALDARKMFDVLSTHEDGSQNFECLLITNPSNALTDNHLKNSSETVELKPKITASLLKEQLHELFNNKASAIIAKHKAAT